MVAVDLTLEAAMIQACWVKVAEDKLEDAILATVIAKDFLVVELLCWLGLDRA
jgi:hypothetical protein